MNAEPITTQAPFLNLATAATLTLNIRFGTSTWAYPGWRGIVYQAEYKNEADFKKRCLSEYAACPLFRTVSLDSAFYRPPSASVLSRYAEQVPENFQWVAKVWERISIAIYPKHARYGAHAGQANPDFLNADLFSDKVLAPCLQNGLRRHCGPFIFQFATFPPEYLKRNDFIARLSEFFSRLPKGFRYACEIRNPELLARPYFDVLNQHGVTHCFNHWHIMPSLKFQMQQAALAGGLKTDFFVARLLTPSGVKYEEAVTLFKPYDRIKQPNPEMRADAARLVRRALQKHGPSGATDAYILVNNRAEGNAPLTIDAILGLLVEQPSD